MHQSIIYALDFDGVICDSAVETGIAGWKAAKHLWNDMDVEFPKADLVEQFRQIRPFIETGYEAILAMRMLFEDELPESFPASFAEQKQRLLKQCGLDTDQLKHLFGDTRDQWIKNSPQEWRLMNPLFKGIAEKLIRLSNEGIWYIVTTKQERFVREILAANQITIPKDHIFGLDRNMSKEEVLIKLIERHPTQSIYFVEDRLPTLVRVLQNQKLKELELFFADWGYNTEKDKKDASELPIRTIRLDTFLT